MKNFCLAVIVLLLFGLLLFSCQNTTEPVNFTQSDQSSSENFAKKVNQWKIPGDFATIQEAINDASVLDGDVILVGPGTFAGALMTKAVLIKGIGKTIIDSGPAHGSGLSQGFRFMAGSGGAGLSHLTFTTDLSIMNDGAVNNVSISHCTFLNSVQAVSNWRGSGWEINHNEIVDLSTRNGGGIGILVADFSGGIVENNVVSHNTISGTLFVGGACADDPGCEQGGYNGSGIVIYADFRWGGAGADEIKNNQVVKNKVTMTSDNPGVVDIVAFELTDTRDDINADPYPVIFDNSIGFNDWRGTELQMVFTPEVLEDENYVSRNFGDNRGQGLHPNLFGPGGN